ncbi:MAG: hypothetical protein AAFR17_18905, partial [Pseudomonadota bacterium]
MTKTIDTSGLTVAGRMIVDEDGVIGAQSDRSNQATHWAEAAAMSRRGSEGQGAAGDSAAYRNSRSGWIKRLAVVMAFCDLLAVALGFGIGVLIADGVRATLGMEGIAATQFLIDRSSELILLAMLLIGIFAFGGLYRRNIWELDEIRRIVAGICLVAMFDATMQFVLRDHSSRLWFMAAYPMIAVSVISLRMVLRSIPVLK